MCADDTLQEAHLLLLGKGQPQYLRMETPVWRWGKATADKKICWGIKKYEYEDICMYNKSDSAKK